MCNSDLVYFISEVVDSHYDRVLPGDMNSLLSVIDILKDDHFSLKIDISILKDYTSFSYTEIGKQLDILAENNLLDDSANGDLFLILDDKLKVWIEKQKIRNGEK